MKHPWSKMFDKALRKSKLEDNLVLDKAEELFEKGYNPSEIAEVLLRLQKSLIDDKDAAIVGEALIDFREAHMEDEEDESSS